MKVMMLGVLGTLLVGPAAAVAGPTAPSPDRSIVVLPIVREADTSETLAMEATRAITAELKKDGVAATAMDPALPGARTCLADGRASARACAASASASGARYALAGRLYAFAYMTRANLPVQMTLTLYDVRSGQPVWTGAYGDGQRGSFSHAVSAYSDVQLGARALASSFVADPATARLAMRQD